MQKLRLGTRDWGPAAALVCWGPGVVGLVLGGHWPGFAAGAESAGSAAGGPSSRHISTVPCGRTDGRPAAADAGTPTTNTKDRKVKGIAL